MTLNGSSQYATAAAFRRALEDRLKAEAKARGRSVEELRREFLFQRFLAMLFSAPDAQWVLKGGASLLMRLVEARFSRDLDLLRLGTLGPEQAISELRELTAPRHGDHLTFVIEEESHYSTINPVVEINVTAYIGAVYGRFPIDLATDLHLVSAPDRIRPQPVVDVPGLPALPELVVYPLTDQVADKVCAMFEVHGQSQSPSSRYRDLLDLALIVTTSELDGQHLALSVASETTRRKVNMPSAMRSPGPNWPAGYAAIARRSRIAKHLYDMSAALQVVGACLNPILSGARSAGVWNPASGWSPGRPHPDDGVDPRRGTRSGHQRPDGEA